MLSDSRHEIFLARSHRSRGAPQRPSLCPPSRPSSVSSPHLMHPQDLQLLPGGTDDRWSTLLKTWHRPTTLRAILPKPAVIIIAQCHERSNACPEVKLWRLPKTCSSSNTPAHNKICRSCSRNHPKKSAEPARRSLEKATRQGPVTSDAPTCRQQWDTANAGNSEKCIFGSPESQRCQRPPRPHPTRQQPVRRPGLQQGRVYPNTMGAAVTLISSQGETAVHITRGHDTFDRTVDKGTSNKIFRPQRGFENTKDAPAHHAPQSQLATKWCPTEP